MNVLYFDPIVGCSGDMIIAALIDCGVPLEYLKERLRFVPGTRLKVLRVKKHGVSARAVRFEIKRRITEKEFIPLIKKSRLSRDNRDTAIKIINRIFTVEKKIHGTDHLHLHELADADTLLDIAGALVCLDYLNVDRIFSKPLKAGQGFIKTVEGRMPAFNYATAQLLKGFPVEFLPIHAELTTPTGAAIVSTLAEPESALQFSRIRGIGMGAGTMDFKDYPNFLRVFVGETSDYRRDRCLVIETNIDDMNPQDYDSVFEKLYAAGALEVFLTPVIMKGSRPGNLLTILCKDDAHALLNIVFTETSTLGVRIRETERWKLPRSTISVPSPYGRFRVKVARIGTTRKISFEYRDLRRLAQSRNLTIQELRMKLATYVEKALK